LSDKIITVVGATGAQGGGLVHAIMSDPDNGFTARAITRDINSDGSKHLAEMGAEVVTANVEDRDSLIKAFEGAYGAFCVTFFWEHFSPEKELEHAGNMAHAAKEAGVQHVVWSTLEDTRKWIPLDDDRMPTLMDHYKVPHFDCKGEADSIFADLNLSVTNLLTSFYWDNFIHFGMGPMKGPDGKLGIAFPLDDKKLPGIAAADIGKCALGIFKSGNKYMGKTVGIAGEHLTGDQMAAGLSKVAGEEVQYHAVPANVYRTFDFPGAEDIGNMFQFKRDFETDFCGARNLDESRQLNPELLTFDEWLAEYGSQIPIG